MEKLKLFIDKYFISVIKEHYFDFEGRTGRYAWAGFLLVNIVASLLIGLIDRIWGAQILSSIYGLVMLLPGLGINVRRLHDHGKSGWWLLVVFIPVVGALGLLIYCLMKGQETENEYGPVPDDKKFGNDPTIFDASDDLTK